MIGEIFLLCPYFVLPREETKGGTVNVEGWVGGCRGFGVVFSRSGRKEVELCVECL